MAVCTYKDGVMELVAPEYLAAQLEAGWSLDNPDAEVTEGDEGVGEDLTVNEMRVLAEANDIEGAADMHHKTLKKALQDAELI